MTRQSFIAKFITDHVVIEDFLFDIGLEHLSYDVHSILIWGKGRTFFDAYGQAI